MASVPGLLTSFVLISHYNKVRRYLSGVTGRSSCSSFTKTIELFQRFREGKRQEKKMNTNIEHPSGKTVPGRVLVGFVRPLGETDRKSNR